MMFLVMPIFTFKSPHFELKFPFKIVLKMVCHGCNLYDALFGRFGTDFGTILNPKLAPKSGPNRHLQTKNWVSKTFWHQKSSKMPPNPVKTPSRLPKTSRITPQTIQNGTKIERQSPRKPVSPSESSIHARKQQHNHLLVDVPQTYQSHTSDCVYKTRPDFQRYSQ